MEPENSAQFPGGFPEIEDDGGTDSVVELEDRELLQNFEMLPKQGVGVPQDEVVKHGRDRESINRSRPQPHGKRLLVLLVPLGVRLVPNILVDPQQVRV